jgi:3,4-dihydroxy 2-butanone 4-phosphate synthase
MKSKKTGSNNIEDAKKALRQGKIVLVFDSPDREGETDLTKASQFITYQDIEIFRRDGGGLICTTVDPTTRRFLGIPYLTELQSRSEKDFSLLKELAANYIPYDSKSSFAITINHRKTFTGITDKDRALTIKSFAEFMEHSADLSQVAAKKEFGRMFRSPGHIHLLNANDGLCSKRQGHSELTTSLMLMSGLIPSATICEMMASTGNALSKQKAKEYAKEHKLVFLEGKEIIEAWKTWLG